MAWDRILPKAIIKYKEKNWQIDVVAKHFEGFWYCFQMQAQWSTENTCSKGN